MFFITQDLITKIRKVHEGTAGHSLLHNETKILIYTYKNGERKMKDGLDIYLVHNWKVAKTLDLLLVILLSFRYMILQ